MMTSTLTTPIEGPDPVMQQQCSRACCPGNRHWESASSLGRERHNGGATPGKSLSLGSITLMPTSSSWKLRLYRQKCILEESYLGGQGSIESHLVPGGHEDPRGREPFNWETSVDVGRGSLQQLLILGLPIVHLACDAVVDVGPEGGHKGPAVSQWEGIWGELADRLAKGHHPIVVHLRARPDEICLSLLTK